MMMIWMIYKGSMYVLYVHITAREWNEILMSLFIPHEIYLELRCDLKYSYRGGENIMCRFEK